MATKDKSTIVSGMGLGMSIIQSLVGKAQRRGVPDEVIHSLATPEGEAMLDQFVEVMVGTGHTTNEPTYPVSVSYALSLKEMIAAGRYNWVNFDITEKHFPMKGEGTKEIITELVHFNLGMSSDDALRELDKRSLRPVTIEKLLAFGAKYPELQRQFPIVALGSFWQRLDDRLVPFLWGSAGDRRLHLRWFGLRWDDDYRFLALRK